MDLEKGFEILNEYLEKDKSVKVIYRFRGILKEELGKWIKVLEFPIKPFYVWIKGTKISGVYYDIHENITIFYIKPREDDLKIKIELGMKGVFLEGVLKNAEINHLVHFKYRHLYVLSIPLNFPVKILSPKGYSLRKTRKSIEYVWKKNKGATRMLIARFIKA